MDDFYLFLDESGNHGLTELNPDFPVFLLCGVLIGAAEYQKFRERLNVIKNKYWGNKEVHFHSRDIRKCQNEFQVLLDYEIKRSFYEDLNKAIRETNFTIIATAIKKDEYVKKFGKLSNDVYELSLSFVIERAVFYMDDVRSPLKRLSIIIENRGRKEDKKLEEHFQRLLSRGTGYIVPDRLKSYGLSIHFRNKKDNVNGIQLADLVAYPTARYIINPERANPAMDIFADKFYSKNGIRYGLKIYP